METFEGIDFESVTVEAAQWIAKNAISIGQAVSKILAFVPYVTNKYL